MKNLLSTLTAAAVIAGTFTMPATAYTTEKPAEYNHSSKEAVENDKLYISGYQIEDTKVAIEEKEIPNPEDYYGVDENGEIYVKGEDGEKTSVGSLETGFFVEVYLIKNGKKKLVNTHETTWDSSDPWCYGLKPYTTNTFQIKIYYPVGTVTNEQGKEEEVCKIHWSDPIKIRTCPRKTGFTFTKVARHTARLRWKAVKCEGYKLQQYNYKKKKWATIRTLPKSKTSAKLTGLKADTKYKFRVMPYGHVADKKYPRRIFKETPDEKQRTHISYSCALFAKPSKAVVLRTKK